MNFKYSVFSVEPTVVEHDVDVAGVKVKAGVPSTVIQLIPADSTEAHGTLKFVLPGGGHELGFAVGDAVTVSLRKEV